jgi:ferredoxin
VSEALDALRSSLARHGLDRLRIMDGAAWDTFAAPAHACAAMVGGPALVIVVGNAGPALWEAFVAALRTRTWSEEHPLDAYVRRSVAEADAYLHGWSRRWVFGDAGDTDLLGDAHAGTAAIMPRHAHLDMRTLGERAGIGVRGRLELLMDPEAGPWIGLRAACFLRVDLSGAFREEPSAIRQDATPDGFAPCRTCDACARACPGGAFPAGRFDIRACVAFRSASPTCADGCAARRACPVGAAHAYPRDAERYHSNRTEGRRVLAEVVGRPL